MYRCRDDSFVVMFPDQFRCQILNPLVSKTHYSTQSVCMIIVSLLIETCVIRCMKETDASVLYFITLKNKV